MKEGDKTLPMVPPEASEIEQSGSNVFEKVKDMFEKRELAEESKDNQVDMDTLLRDIENDPDLGKQGSRNTKQEESKTKDDVFAEAVSLGIGVAAVNKVTELTGKIRLLQNEQEDEDYL